MAPCFDYDNSTEVTELIAMQTSTAQDQAAEGIRLMPRGLKNSGNLCFMNATLQASHLLNAIPNFPPRYCRLPCPLPSYSVFHLDKSWRTHFERPQSRDFCGWG